MSEKPVSKKRPIPNDGQQVDSKIDTVSLMCIAVVPKDEYDEMMVSAIDPVIVRGRDGQEVRINPFLLVGSYDNTREEAINRVNSVWEAYKKRMTGDIT
jgi:hypothetical protein